MSYPINYPTPQGANIQIFKQGGTTSDWVKPQGASFVWFTLIGAGGGGGGYVSGQPGDGGGSGAVTNCMVPAFLIPDVLQVVVGFGTPGTVASNGTSGTSSQVLYQQKNTTGYLLLTANGGGGGDVVGGGGPGAGGSNVASNYFSCMGFFQSVAGQAGGVAGTSTPVASTTTFLGGGGSLPSANFGYPDGSASLNGFFQMQPIIVGRGGADGGSGSYALAGIGCGSSGAAVGQPSAPGGNGLVVIITW